MLTMAVKAFVINLVQILITASSKKTVIFLLFINNISFSNIIFSKDVKTPANYKYLL